MNTNEDYLDSLLKSLEESDTKENNTEETTISKAVDGLETEKKIDIDESEEASSDALFDMNSDEIDKMLENLSFDEDTESSQEENSSDNADLDIAGFDDEKLGEIDVNDEEVDENIAELLKQISDEVETDVQTKEEENELQGQERAELLQDSLSEEKAENEADEKPAKKRKKWGKNKEKVQNEDEQNIEVPDKEIQAKEGQDKEEKQNKEKKPSKFLSLLMKIFVSITDEVDLDEDDSQTDGLSGENDGQNSLTAEKGALAENAENINILEELGKEDQKKEDKKKDKKEKKGKKGKKGEAEEGEEGEEGKDGKPKKEKKKKEKKVKKVKEKSETEPEKTKRLAKKNVIAIFLFCFSILGGILIFATIVPQFLQLREARQEYYAGEYEACFDLMYGRTLNESDQIMFERSKLFLQLDRTKQQYDIFMQQNNRVYALDTLLTRIDNFSMIREKAEKYQLVSETEAAYQEILELLSTEFGISEEEALLIIAHEEDVIYTLHVKAIAEGTEFVLPDFLNDNYSGETTLPENTAVEEMAPQQENEIVDILPAEEELTETNFID